MNFIPESLFSFTWILFSFLCGSLPFSVWTGKIFLRVDIRQTGDGNPGAANVFRSGGKALALFTLLLDVSKAAVPVGLAYQNLGIRGVPMFFIAIAPVLGHVFSPFLGFRGGKALAATLGVWIGLTIWKASLAAVLATMIGFSLIIIPGWAVVAGLAGILIAILCWIPDPLLEGIWASNTLILIWTHHADLRQRPQIRPWIKNLLRLPQKR